MNEEIDKLVGKFLMLKVKADALKEEMDFIKSNIKIYMEADSLDKYFDEIGNQVSFRETTRKSLDKALVERKLSPEVFENCFKETTFTTCTIRTAAQLEMLKNRKMST